MTNLSESNSRNVFSQVFLLTMLLDLYTATGLESAVDEAKQRARRNPIITALVCGYVMVFAIPFLIFSGCIALVFSPLFLVLFGTFCGVVAWGFVISLPVIFLAYGVYWIWKRKGFIESSAGRHHQRVRRARSFGQLPSSSSSSSSLTSLTSADDSNERLLLSRETQQTHNVAVQRKFGHNESAGQEVRHMAEDQSSFTQGLSITTVILELIRYLASSFLQTIYTAISFPQRVFAIISTQAMKVELYMLDYIESLITRWFFEDQHVRTRPSNPRGPLAVECGTLLPSWSWERFLSARDTLQTAITAHPIKIALLMCVTSPSLPFTIPCTLMALWWCSCVIKVLRALKPLMVWIRAMNELLGHPDRVVPEGCIDRIVLAPMWFPVYMCYAASALTTLPYHFASTVTRWLFLLVTRRIAMPIWRRALRDYTIIRLRVQLVVLRGFDSLDSTMYYLLIGKSMVKRQPPTITARDESLLAIDWPMDAYYGMNGATGDDYGLDWPFMCIKSWRDWAREILRSSPLLVAMVTPFIAPFVIFLSPLLLPLWFTAWWVRVVYRAVITILNIIIFVRAVCGIIKEFLDEVLHLILTWIFFGQQLFFAPYILVGMGCYYLGIWTMKWVKVCYLTFKYLILRRRDPQPWEMEDDVADSESCFPSGSCGYTYGSRACSCTSCEILSDSYDEHEQATDVESVMSDGVCDTASGVTHSGSAAYFRFPSSYSNRNKLIREEEEDLIITMAGVVDQNTALCSWQPNGASEEPLRYTMTVAKTQQVKPKHDGEVGGASGEVGGESSEVGGKSGTPAQDTEHDLRKQIIQTDTPTFTAGQHGALNAGEIAITTNEIAIRNQEQDPRDTSSKPISKQEPHPDMRVRGCAILVFVVITCAGVIFTGRLFGGFCIWNPLDLIFYIWNPLLIQ